MDNNVHLGDGVLDEAKEDFNNKTKELVKIAMDVVFDSIGDKVKDFPEIIKQLRNNPANEKKVADLWSERLAEEGFVPSSYNGLSNGLLISNFHQEGYLDGLYVGYVLAMMSLVDNNVPKELIIAVRDYVRPNLVGHHYDNRDKFISQYKDEKYSWIDVSKEGEND